MARQPAKILLAEDNKANRDLLARRLINSGFDVIFAEDGKQALDAIAEPEHTFDLVLLDVMMPEVDGIEVLRTTRQNFSMVKLPIIMVTARDQSEHIVEAFRLGANDYVTKPVNFHILLARIYTHLSLRRLAAINEEILTTATHDLKKPLALIDDISSTLQEEISEGICDLEDIQGTLPIISKTTQQMQGIVERFLDLQSLGSEHNKLVQVQINLNTLASLAIQYNKDYAAKKGIILATELDENIPKATADQVRINQVFDNFVGNAIKFCPKGATTTIVTSHTDLHAKVEVIDNGPGLSDKDMEKVFTKFAHLSNRPTGTESSSGLGLAICKEVIEMHGGEIGVNNNEDGGANFWFSLPTSNSD